MEVYPEGGDGARTPEWHENRRIDVRMVAGRGAILRWDWMTKSVIEKVGAGHGLKRAAAEAEEEEVPRGRVAKNGNRAASSQSGSADVLEELGVRIDLPFERYGRAIRVIGIGFLFAQAAHTATRHAAPARKQIGVRTVFNLLGPLTNPAGAQAQVLGVFSEEVIGLVAATLAELGVERAFVVHGACGLDEISLAGETMVAEVRGGAVRRFTVTPEEFGVARAPLEAIRGGTAAENAALIVRILQGEDGPARDIVVVNAAAALVAAGVGENFREAAGLASFVISSGAASEKLAALAAFTNKN